MRGIVVAALVLAGCGAEPSQKDETIAKATDASLPLSSPLGQAQIDAEKGSVILHCRGVDGKEVKVYRLNGLADSFETWDGVKFNAWVGGDLTFNADHISFVRLHKDNDRIIEIIRSTGAIEDRFTMRDSAGDHESVFTGTCEVGDQPKPIERKF